eukprot:5844216-Pyramimonas_sp.AAC.1
MCSFVQKWSGGEDGRFLNEIVDYAKCIGDQRRDISPKTFAALAQAQLASAPRWVIACLKAGLVAPDSFCKDGVSNLVTATDLSELQHTGTKHLRVMECSVFFDQVDEFLKTIQGLPPATATKVSGDLHVRCVMMVMGKRAKGRKVYGTLDDIKAKFMEE